jgi:hypothetical protein
MAYSESERKDHVLPPQEPGKQGQVKKVINKNIFGGTSPVYFKFNNGKWEPAKRSEYLQSSPNIVNYKVMPDLGFKGANAAANYRYPDDIAVGFDTDYVMFEFYKYNPPFQGINKGATKDGSSAVRAYNQSVEDAKFYEADRRGLGPVILYMPEDISTGYKANWSGKAFSNIGRDMLSAAGSDDINEMAQNSLTALGTATNQMIPNAMNSLIRKTISKITGESVSQNDLFSATRGVILNPNVELLFQGTDLRNLQLNYKLVPRNSTEAEKIKNIIDVFRKSMLPSFAKNGDIRFSEGTNLANNFIQVPNVCKLTFMRGGDRNPDVAQYKMCAITNVEVNYTPDGTYATYGDGTMVAYGLSLSFQETKLVFAEEVDRY